MKCENEAKGKSIPLQTFRECTKRYLGNELTLVPSDWPLIAIGREAYKALAYSYPARTVIGIPHPTGSHGNYETLFDGQKLHSACKIDLRAEKGKAIWLGDRLHA